MAKDIGAYSMNINEPDIFKRRSYMPNLSHSSHFTMDAGELVPMDRAWSIIPGDSWKLKQATLIRMTNPPKTPTMDQLVVDYYYFYTPYRVLDGKFDQFITGDNGTQWNQANNLTAAYYKLSHPVSGTGGQDYTVDAHNTVYQYLHMLPGSFKVKTSAAPNITAGFVQAYPVMNYYRIWNDYFRIKFLQAEINGTYTANGGQVSDINLGTVTTTRSLYRNSVGVGLATPPSAANGALCFVNRLGDYFSTALPSPQKGGDTLLDLSIPASASSILSGTVSAITPDSATGNVTSGTATAFDSSVGLYSHDLDANGYSILGFTGLKGGTVAALRQAFAIDSVKTLDARYGTYITDYTYAHFGCVLPDYRAPRPEYLGKRRFYFNINQVIQSSETGATPQGNAGAWGQTMDPSSFIFSKSFTEFGIIQGVMCVRVLNHSYSQGIDRQFQKFNRFDFYLPQLANVSDMPILKSEIFADFYTPTNITNLAGWIKLQNSKVWAYQEAWSEYKFMYNSVAGMLDPTVPNNLGIWTYTDFYSSEPTYNSSWMTEPIDNIDNTLMLPHSTAPQFIVDCFFEIDAYRVMPIHNEPGQLTGAW